MTHTAFEQASALILLGGAGLVGITVMMVVGIEAAFYIADFVRWVRS